MPAIRTINLSNGYQALVDATDFDSINQHEWHATVPRRGYVYAMRQALLPDGRKVSIYMHRELLGLQPGDGLNADHVDHQGLNNCRSNIRVASPTQNQMNRGRNRNNRSGYKGVSLNPNLSAARCWVAKLSIAGVQTIIAHCADPVTAAVLYDEAAVAYFGAEFAFTNFPTTVAA